MLGSVRGARGAPRPYRAGVTGRKATRLTSWSSPVAQDRAASTPLMLAGYATSADAWRSPDRAASWPCLNRAPLEGLSSPWCPLVFGQVDANLGATAAAQRIETGRCAHGCAEHGLSARRESGGAEGERAARCAWGPPSDPRHLRPRARVRLRQSLPAHGVPARARQCRGRYPDPSLAPRPV